MKSLFLRSLFFGSNTDRNRSRRDRSHTRLKTSMPDGGLRLIIRHKRYTTIFVIIMLLQRIIVEEM